MTTRIHDNNGWFEITKNPLTRAGIFNYRGSSIGAPNKDKMYKVYRPASELAKPETLNSFRLVPFVIDHAMLGSATVDAIPAEEKGVHGVIGENLVFDQAEQTVFGNIKVFSTQAIKNFNNGKKVDISLGYLAKYDFTPGTFKGETYDAIQYDIKGNHGALVDNGRMGKDVKVLDEGLTITFDLKDFEPMTIDQAAMDAAIEKATKPLLEANAAQAETIKTLTDGLTAMRATIDKMNDDDEENDDDMEDVLDSAGKPVMDSEGKPMRKKKEPTSAMDAAAVVATVDAAVAKATRPLVEQIEALKSGGAKVAIGEIATRDELAGKLSQFVGSFDHKEMTVQDVAEYGVKKLEIPAVKGNEITVITAYLHGRVPARPTHTMDARDIGKKTSVSKYVTGE